MIEALKYRRAERDDKCSRSSNAVVDILQRVAGALCASREMREEEGEREERYRTLSPATTTMRVSRLSLPSCVSVLSSLFSSSSSPPLDFRPQPPPLSSVRAQSRATTKIRLAIIVDKVEQCRTPRVRKREGEKIPSRDKVATWCVVLIAHFELPVFSRD